jgi:hypothetical protein
MSDATRHPVYRIRVEGHLDQGWQARFPGLVLTRTDDGDTLLTGPVADQAALHGLLKKVRDLGVPLISIERVAPGRTSPS